MKRVHVGEVVRAVEGGWWSGAVVRKDVQVWCGQREPAALASGHAGVVQMEEEGEVCCSGRKRCGWKKGVSCGSERGCADVVQVWCSWRGREGQLRWRQWVCMCGAGRGGWWSAAVVEKGVQVWCGQRGPAAVVSGRASVVQMDQEGGLLQW